MMKNLTILVGLPLSLNTENSDQLKSGSPTRMGIYK